MSDVVEGVIEELRRGLDRLGNVLQRSSSGSGNLADRARAAGYDGMNQAAETWRQVRDTAIERGGPAAEGLADTVRQRPLASIGLALALGFALARLARR